ncbi:MAG: T9SS C-terminal target domain-containing protein [Ignavibacteriae bacterium]|nr:MAG: T9SS C-terminal target domain-containing protein [Ignavibacteriota bacterium]
MKQMFTRNTKVVVFSFLFVFVTSLYVFSSSGGFTGRTLKTSTSGCGGCHGSTSSSDVNVFIGGPDTITVGQTGAFSVTLTRAGSTGSGIDIAAKNGSLAAVSPFIHVSNGELTHNANIPLVLGNITFLFNYTAPPNAGTDTIFATGLATNSDGTTGGDFWNWAPNRVVTVINPIGLNNNSEPVEFRLEQNYPNPFNPATTISFSVPKTAEVTIKVYDIAGNEVADIFSGKVNSGTHEVKWTPQGVASGVYFYKLVSEDFSAVRKMMLVK